MKRIIGMLVILAAGIYIAVYLTFLSIPAAEVFNHAIPKTPLSRYNMLEDRVYGFISNKLTGKDGEILTNIQNYKGSKDALSESTGLMMNYLALSNKQEEFIRQFYFLKSRLLTNENFIRWRTGSIANSNAAIDDLRIIRALLDGFDMWGDKEYYDMAGILQENIFKHQVKDRRLYELYDWNTNKTSRSIPLCYLDFYTIDRISEFNPAWVAVEEQSLAVAQSGRLGGNSPFFYKYYDYNKNSYALDEEYKKQKGICITYTLYTVLHLAEVNEDTSFFTRWLRDEINKGKLYAWYDPFTLKPANDVESTAVYALAAIYAEKAGEKELYFMLIDKMMKFMVTDRKSDFYGGFGDPATKYFHSFDNLTALWALSISEGR